MAGLTKYVSPSLFLTQVSEFKSQLRLRRLRGLGCMGKRRPQGRAHRAPRDGLITTQSKVGVLSDSW
jgi:hypothetical protein